MQSKEIPMTPFLHSKAEGLSTGATSFILDDAVVVLKRGADGQWKAFEVTGIEDTERARYYAGMYLQTMSTEQLAGAKPI